LGENNYQIKSLRVFQTNNQISFPISLHGSKITIEFDLMSEDSPNWEILFLFCDKDWQPYDNGLLIDDFSNTERNLWFQTLPNYSDRANYHYSGSFPNDNVKFPFSGKWMFFIQDAFDNDLVYGEGKIFVVNETAMNIETTISESSMQGEIIVPAVFGNVIDLKTSVKVPDSLFVDKVSHVEIIENKKIEDPIVVGKTYDNESRYYEVDGYNAYSYFARDIQPGGAYRQVDLMDKTKYSAPKTFAHFEGIEISNKFKPAGRDFFGGSKLMDFQKPYSEYLDVEFRLKLLDKKYKNVFLVGAFSNWDIYPELRMIENNGIYSTTIELKRGIYDYQYVVVDMRNSTIKSINWIELEGNSWSTKREYYIFLFYRADEYGGYDKIIAYNRIRN
jgi:hypothetical protein